MLKFTKDSNLNIDIYEERIKQKGFIYIDKEILSLLVNYETSRTDTLRSLVRRNMNAEAFAKYIDLSKQALLRFLIEDMRCPESAFVVRGVNSMSLDSSRVLVPLMEKGYAVEFLTDYIEYSSSKQQSSRGTGLLRSLHPTLEEGINGRPLSRLAFSVEQQQNLRYNYRNTDIISIPKQYTPSFTVEDGYLLVWGDFKQADWRIAYNLFIRDEYNLKIMESCDDSYEGAARILADFLGEEFDSEKFKEERDLYKVNVLQTVYGQRHGKNPRDHKFITTFARYLQTCERYVEYYKRIEEMIELELPIPVTGYFGFEQFVPIVNNNKKSTIDKALNTPVQTGTSQIIILTVNAILDKFYSLGYTEEDVSLYIVRHDEPIFKIKKEVLKDAWVFDNASHILVDSWTPLNVEFSYGYYYGKIDTDLQGEAEISYEYNKGKHDIYEPDKSSIEFMPIAKTLSLCVGLAEVGDKTVASIYNKKTHTAKYILVDSTDKKEVTDTIKDNLLSSENAIYLNGFTRGVLVYNLDEGDSRLGNSLYFKFTRKYNSDSVFSTTLADYMAYRYSKKHNIPYETDMENLKINEQLIKTVGVLDVLEQ